MCLKYNCQLSLLDKQSKLDAVTKNAAAAKEAASQELALMRRQLVSTQAMLQEKDASLNQSKEQLSQQQVSSYKPQNQLQWPPGKNLSVGGRSR